MKRLKCIDLFAGCGGLSLGLHLAGWKGLFAIEKNRDAFLTLKFNLIDKKNHFDWPEWLPQRECDIEELLTKKSKQLLKLRGEIDLVVGGPPCQGFSMAGRRRESDHRNTLFESYLAFVRTVEPTAIMFENVRGFTMEFKANPDAGVAYSKRVIEKLQALGYSDARGELIDMSDYGVPQRRVRFIVIATRINMADSIFETIENDYISHLADLGIPKRNTVRSAVSDLQRCHGFTQTPDSKRFYSGFSSYSTTGLQKHLRSIQTPYCPDSHRFVNHTEDVKEVFTKLLKGADRNRCIQGKDRDAFGLKKRSVTVLAGNKPAPTLTTIPDDFVHYSEPRVMTVRECARLQTFPDWFEFKGRYTTGGKNRVLETPRYTQVGNAVPPLFARLVGLALKEALKNV